jgi:3-hydroxyisobutyrate dehydrogenase-like beta-hydroxyacid dehydrogenase
VTEEVGRASAMKLCRSIIIKGLEALLIDCANAAQRWDVEREVFASLGATFPSIDWKQLSLDMPKRVHQHGLRRAAEMREAAQMLQELGYDPRLATAVADQQEANARPKAG